MSGLPGWPRVAGWVCGVGVLCATACLKVPAPPVYPGDEGVGLAITVENGAAPTLTLVPGQRYYVASILERARVTGFPAPDALDWLQAQSPFAPLDWRGLALAQEDWANIFGQYTWNRTYLGAAWMLTDHKVTVEVLDASGGTLVGPISLSAENFVMRRASALAWSDDALGKGNLGQNAVGSDQLAASSSGTYGGDVDDVYTVTVSEAGPLDGTGQVTVTSVRGDTSSAPLGVVDGVPLELGSQGARLALHGLVAGVALARGDRWFLRCTAKDHVVGPAQPGVVATFNASAEVFWGAPRTGTPLFTLPAGATALRVAWDHLPTPVTIALRLEPNGDVGYGLGFEVKLSPPRNGGFYQAGDRIVASVHLTDGAGHPLHADDTLPTYNQFLQATANGIKYFAVESQPCVPFFSQCSLNIFELSVAGPLHEVAQNYTFGDSPTTIGGHEFPETSVAFIVPFNPAVGDVPIENGFVVDLPADAKPGTYAVVGKAARHFKGELVQRPAVVRFQVGGTVVTDFATGVGNCDLCHLGDASLRLLRHGFDDGRMCKICHNRPYGLGATVLHRVHLHAPGYLPPRNDCTVCHLSATSNRRASRAVCGSCHGDIHPPREAEDGDGFGQCGMSCHAHPPNGHVSFPLVE